MSLSDKSEQLFCCSFFTRNLWWWFMYCLDSNCLLYHMIKIIEIVLSLFWVRFLFSLETGHHTPVVKSHILSVCLHVFCVSWTVRSWLGCWNVFHLSMLERFYWCHPCKNCPGRLDVMYWNNLIPTIISAVPFYWHSGELTLHIDCVISECLKFIAPHTPSAKHPVIFVVFATVNLLISHMIDLLPLIPSGDNEKFNQEIDKYLSWRERDGGGGRGVGGGGGVKYMYII